MYHFSCVKSLLSYQISAPIFSKKGSENAGRGTGSRYSVKSDTCL